MDNVPHVKGLKKARALVGGDFLPDICQLTNSYSALAVYQYIKRHLCSTCRILEEASQLKNFKNE
jgi:hypothetical protein